MSQSAHARSRTGLVVVAVVVAVLVVVGLLWVNRPAATTSGSPGAGSSASAPSPLSSPTSAGPLHAQPSTTLARRPGCGPARHPFAPVSISIPGVTRDASVVRPPRDANNIPGTPPVTTAGKSLFAWDTAQGTMPGQRHGNVLLNAHTWPDGSALGNRMLASLHPGDRIVVHGASQRLCYRVTERVEVLAVDGLPRYYAKDGPPQLAILACSGTRLGPGNWTKRTVWFASPTA
jgi:hypothetical protein